MHVSCPPTLTPSILYPDSVCTTNRSLALSFAANAPGETARASSGSAIRAKPASEGAADARGWGWGTRTARAGRPRETRRGGDLNDEAGRACATRAARMHASRASKGTPEVCRVK